MHTLPTIALLSDLKAEYSVGTTDITLKGYYETRVGFYGGSWLTPIYQYGFPLDPKQPFRYVVPITASYGGLATDKVALCWVFRTRTDYNSGTFTNPGMTAVREIHICPFWKNVA